MCFSAAHDRGPQLFAGHWLKAACSSLSQGTYFNPPTWRISLAHASKMELSACVCVCVCVWCVCWCMYLITGVTAHRLCHVLLVRRKSEVPPHLLTHTYSPWMYALRDHTPHKTIHQPPYQPLYTLGHLQATLEASTLPGQTDEHLTLKPPW